MNRKVAFKTLGCRLNQAETDSLATDFINAGYEIVPFSAKADVYVINTCTVTAQGDQKSRSAIHRVTRNGDGSVVLVTGCMVHRLKRDDEPGITYLVENKRKYGILPLVEDHFKGLRPDPDRLPGDSFGFSVIGGGFHTRGMVKIQDGCDNFCSYCIVPFVRGRAISRPSGEVLDDIRRMVSGGFREIVLTGVNISRYTDGATNFENLVGKILDLPGNFRLRISSIEPENPGELFFELFAHEKMCPHLHICLQSGSAAVLSRMGRSYTLGSFMSVVDRLRSRYPLFNLTTDVMVGFPGETEEDFRATISVVQQVMFSHIHTFKFSARKGTRAERMTDQVPEKIRNERSAIMREISDTSKYRYRNRLVGTEQLVLVEKIDREGMATGYGQHYVPVTFRSRLLSANCFVPVRVDAVGASDKNMTLQATEMTSADLVHRGAGEAAKAT